MGVKYNYSWTDKGWAAIQRRVNSKARVHVGVINEKAEVEHTDSGLTVGEIAVLQEFGSDDGHTPERSFLRRAVVWNNRAELKHMLAQASRAVLFQGMSQADALQSVGKWAVRKIREVIASGVGPPNAPRTVAEKGHGLTLRDTQLMLQSLGYEVVGGFGIFQGEDDGP